MYFHRFGAVGPLALTECVARHRFQYYDVRRFFSETYYEVLKLPQSCTPKEIRDSFIALSKQNHPDKHQNDPSSHNRFVKINEAYSVLINPSSRRTYDISLERNKKLRAPHSPWRTNTTYNSYNYGYKDPFMWEQKSRSEGSKKEEKAYYGIDGIKKVSNTVIVLFLLFITVFGVGLQLLAIRSSFLRTHESMLEQSRKYNLIHSLAREKAKLYGNAHQIEVLKKSLQVTIPPEEVEELKDLVEVSNKETEVTNEVVEAVLSDPVVEPKPVQVPINQIELRAIQV